MKVKVINCLISKRRKKGFFTNLNHFFGRVAEDGKKKNLYGNEEKSIFIDTKT